MLTPGPLPDPKEWKPQDSLVTDGTWLRRKEGMEDGTIPHIILPQGHHCSPLMIGDALGHQSPPLTIGDALGHQFPTFDDQ